MGDPGDTSVDRSQPWLRSLGLILGLVLLGAAVVFVFRQRGTVGEALSALASPDPILLAILLASVLGNLLITAVLLRLLLSRFGKVDHGEMVSLIATAGLLNYLPMRPGLMGRVAYHKKYNGIDVRQTFRVMVEAIGLGGVCTVWGIVCLLAGHVSEPLFWPLVLGPFPILAACAGFAPAARVWALAGLLRYLDLLLTAARYLVAFRLLDHAVGFDTAMLLAGLSLITTLIPFLSNGLGVREWAVAWLTPVLEPAVQLTSVVALTADLVNRAAELVVIVPAGLIGSAMVARRMQSHHAPTEAKGVAASPE